MAGVTYTNRTWLQGPSGLLGLLKGKDTFFGAPGMGPDYDWPNPNLGRISQGYHQAVRSQGEVWQERNTNLLVGKDKLPADTSEDWDVGPNVNPSLGKPYPSNLRTWIDPTKQWLIGKDKFFGLAGNVNFDWPNPRSPAFPSDLRTYLDSLWPNLLSQDKFFGLGGRPQFDWPVPRGAAYPSDLRGFLSPVELNLLGKDVFFGLAGNPSFDWPVPRGPVFSNDLRGFISPLELNLIGKDRFFGLGGAPQFDWPNPRGPAFPSDQRGFTEPFNLNLQVIVTPAAPFAATDWPNPITPGFAISLRTWIDELHINLINQDRFFWGPGRGPVYDWPNPGLGRPFPTDLRTFIKAPQQGTQIVLSPFHQTNWPVPAGHSLVRFYFSEWRGVLQPLSLGSDRRPFLHMGQRWEGTKK